MEGWDRGATIYKMKDYFFDQGISFGGGGNGKKIYHAVGVVGEEGQVTERVHVTDYLTGACPENSRLVD